MFNSNSSPAKNAASIDQKWGALTLSEEGFLQIPTALLIFQKELELNPTELVVLLNVLRRWWYVDKKPFPRASEIAAYMDVTSRTVHRALNKLEELGYMKRVKQKKEDGSGLRKVYDLTGIVKKLENLCMEKNYSPFPQNVKTA